MSKMKYFYKPFAQIPIKAQTAGECLAELKEKHKKITPELVLKEAKKKKSPLHSCFTWNDTKAALKCRLDEARYLIRMITVKIEGSSIDPQRAFVCVSDQYIGGEDESGHYLPIQEAFTNPATRSLILNRAVNELKEFRKRYEEFEELAKVFDAMDSLDVTG